MTRQCCRGERSNDACAVILSRFYRSKMRNFIKDVNPEIKFRFYEDKTESENNGPPTHPDIYLVLLCSGQYNDGSYSCDRRDNRCGYDRDNRNGGYKKKNW